MAAGGKKACVCVAIGVLATGLLTFGAADPASAAGIFERLFGAFRQYHQTPPPPAITQAFADPLAAMASRFNPPQRRVETGPARAFCVRTCDGSYFPVQAHAGQSAAEACRSFCPASPTRLYAGGTIDYATASDGSRYADLANAFVYRRQLVAGCTCNGRDAFGLAHVDATSDPTLRPGDVVASKSGLMAFTGAKNKTADFTPVANYRAYSPSERAKLSAMKVQDRTPVAAATTSAATPARSDERRSAQLTR